MKGDFSSLAKKKKKTVDEFIDDAAVDGKATEVKLNPKAKRDFKSIRHPFNEYEYKLLEEAAADANLSLLAFIRSSWMNVAKKHKGS